MEINYNPGFSPVLIVIKPPSSHKMRSVGRRGVSHMICSENIPSSKGADLLFFVPKRKYFFAAARQLLVRKGPTLDRKDTPPPGRPTGRSRYWGHENQKRAVQRIFRMLKFTENMTLPCAALRSQFWNCTMTIRKSFVTVNYVAYMQLYMHALRHLRLTGCTY